MSSPWFPDNKAGGLYQKNNRPAEILQKMLGRGGVRERWVELRERRVELETDRWSQKKEDGWS